MTVWNSVRSRTGGPSVRTRTANRFVRLALLGVLAAAPALPASAQQPAKPAADGATPAGATFGELAYHILLGELAGRRGALDVALENYRIAARLSDDPRIAERATGMALLQKEPAATVTLAERWIALEPDNPRARQALIVGLLRSGREDAALEPIEALLAGAGADDGRQGFALLTALLEQLDDPDAGFRVLRQIAGRNADSAYAHYYLALAAVRSERFDQAVAALDRALELRAGWTDALLLRAQVRIQHGDDVAGALAQLERAVTTAPDDRELRLGYARLLVAGDRMDDARRQFELLAESDPEDGDSLYALGLLAADAGQLDAASDYLQRVLALGQRADDVYFELGRIDERRERYREALAWYDRIGEGARLLPGQVRAAAALGELGRWQDAADRLEALRRTHPGETVSLYVTEADLLRDKQRYQQAFDLLSEALTRFPNDYSLLYARALAAERIDRIEVLEQDLLTIIAAEPDNGHALNALGYTLADRTDRYQEALAYLQRAIELLPDDPAVLDSMGWVKYRLGDIDGSLDYLRKAYAINDDPEIVSHLIEVLWTAGEREEARGLWRQMLERVPDSEYLLRLKDRLGPAFASDDRRAGGRAAEN